MKSEVADALAKELAKDNPTIRYLLERAERAEALADQLHGLVSDMQCDCLPYAVRGDGMCERCDALAAWMVARSES